MKTAELLKRIKIFAKRLQLFCGITLLTYNIVEAQNVGISAPPGTAPAGDAGLDVNFTNKGVLIPRISLTNTGTYGLTGGGPTNSMLVFNTNAGIAGTGAAGVGYYYWSTSAGRWVKIIDNFGTGRPWVVGGNTETGGAGTAYIFGHLGNHHIDFYTNGTVRGRLSNLGEFFIGTTNTALPGDLMNAVGNATFPWALNGYTSFNGGAVYGGIQAGTTVYAAVQGESSSTNAQAAGVRGSLLGVTGNGTSFSAVRSGVSGNGTGFGSYRFGVFGSGGTSIRSGGVLGIDYTYAMGALGYYASDGNDYAVYGFGQAHTNGVGGGKFINGMDNSEIILQEDYTIGLGIYGGVMGGWIKGLVYGTNLSGERYGVYVHGKTITNNIIATLHNNNHSNKRFVTYSSQSTDYELQDKGKSKLENGVTKVYFNETFKNIIDTDNEIIINITPLGQSNGLYIEKIERDGFVVKENNNGSGNIFFYWIAYGKIKNSNIEISEEIVDKSFEEKMNGHKGVMYNDNNPENPEYSLWWDGTKIRCDIPKREERKLPDSFYQTCRMCPKNDR